MHVWHYYKYIIGTPEGKLSSCMAWRREIEKEYLWHTMMICIIRKSCKLPQLLSLLCWAAVSIFVHEWNTSLTSPSYIVQRREGIFFQK